MSKKLYINYGCGVYAPKEWLNYDTSPTLRIRKIPMVGPIISKLFHNVPFPSWVMIGDIVKGLPIADNTADFIFCSHVIEHLSLEDAKLAIQNTFTHLKPGGVFRCLLPDIEILMQEYQLAKQNNNPDASHVFLQESILGVEQKPHSFKRRLISALGNYHHLWMWDYAALSNEMSKAGFVNIRRCEKGDMNDPMFDLIEDPTRFHKALYIQATKP